MRALNAKRLLAHLASATGVVVLGATVAAAAPAVAVVPASTSVLPGESFTVSVALSDVTDAYAFQFDVTYDPALVKLTSVANGGFLPDDRFSGGTANANGSVTFVYNLLTGPVAGVSGGGTLATLTFETFADKFGSSAIHVANFVLVDSKGADIAGTTVTDGSASYRDVVAPATTASATPGPNGNGWWNTSSVTVSLHASDSGSGVKRIDYALSGAPSGTISADTADVPVSAEGVSTLTYFATDNAGNAEAPHTFTVRIDRTPPVLTPPPDLIAEATGPGGASVSFAASAIDALSGSGPVTFSPPSGSTFPLGTTLVSASATDLAGNTAARTFRVTVRDTRAPVFASLIATPNVLWPPNDKLVPVRLTASVTDAVDPAPVTRIVFVRSSDDDDDHGHGHDRGYDRDDHRGRGRDYGEKDWEITGPLTLKLRAERDGNQERVYTITVESRDRFGNLSHRKVTVVVPRHR